MRFKTMPQTKSIEILKDSIGNEYLAVIYTEKELMDYILIWKSLFKTDDEMESCINMNFKRFERDGSEYHITIFNASEYDKLKKTFCVPRITNILITIIHDIQIKGIGQVSKGDDISQFLVIDSKILNNIRESYGFLPKYLHITLGFNNKDIHGVDKGINTLIRKL
jgi:hypothetical protein